MSSLPWKGVWYVPGGQSFMSNFIKDAGGNYLYNKELSRESLNLSIEKVMEQHKEIQTFNTSHQPFEILKGINCLNGYGRSVLNFLFVRSKISLPPNLFIA